jgi:NAD/NADP transhydrogenase alpha subunit
MAAKTQLDRIEGAIFGNGREGLIAVTARIEENIEEARGMAEASKTEAQGVRAEQAAGFQNVYLSIGALTRTVETLGLSVDAHHKTEHLSDVMKSTPALVVILDWMKNPKFIRDLIIGGVTSFIVLHVVSTYLPNVWDWAMLLLGLPKFVIPIG